MTTFNKQMLVSRLRALFVLAVTATLLGACMTSTGPQRKAANIEVQEAVGFTITEDVRVAESERLKYHEALNHLGEGDTEKGIALLEEVTAAADSVTAPKIDLGIAYHRQGDLDAAEASLLAALELNARHPAALNELGIVYRKKGRFDKAKRHYEAAIAVYPGYHHARRNLAILCDLYLRDLDCALEQYEAYMATVPADEKANMWIADLKNRIASR